MFGSIRRAWRFIVETRPDAGRDLVAVLTSSDEVKVRISRSVLEAHGIRSIMRNAFQHNAARMGIPGVADSLVAGPIQLLVERQHAERALAALSETDTPDE